jgi:hypothetical protein
MNKDNDGNIRAAYAALVSYHNVLVQARFTVAGLFLAANGFLINAYFQANTPSNIKPAIPILSLLVTWICGILEARTTQLLKNIGNRGKKLEKDIGLNINPDEFSKENQGFFSLMEHQDPKIPPINKPFVNHKFGLSFLYVVIALFWVVLCYFSLLGRNYMNILSGKNLLGLGLFLNFIGALLLWKFGLPKNVNRSGTRYRSVSDIDENEIKKAKVYDKWATIAVILLIVGFVFQFIAIFLP